MLRQGISRKYQGFTLVEVIAVISVLSVIAVLGCGFFISAVKANRLIHVQADLLSEALWLEQRVNRQLRQASPHGFRLSHQRRCLQFLPMLPGEEGMALPRSAVASRTPHAFCLIDHELRYYFTIAAVNTEMVNREMVNGETANRDFVNKPLNLSADYDVIARGVLPLDPAAGLFSRVAGCGHCIRLSVQWRQQEFTLNREWVVASAYYRGTNKE